MVFGIGTDIVDIRRIERIMNMYKAHFLKRVFTPSEIEYCLKAQRPAGRFAKRFAAKEAFFKALGSGFADGISWKNVEVVKNDSSRPDIIVSGNALEKLNNMVYNHQVLLSLSDDYPYAIAYVVIGSK